MDAGRGGQRFFKIGERLSKRFIRDGPGFMDGEKSHRAKTRG